MGEKKLEGAGLRGQVAGKTALSTLSERAINTPTGIPTDIHIITHTVMIATVAIQSFHIPK